MQHLYRCSPLQAWRDFYQLLRGHWFSALGNAFEWYDFCLYGYFALQLSHTFFPPQYPRAALLSIFLIYAVGFFARPLGGVLLGHLGDRYGHVRVLYWAVNGVALPTLLLGLLPGYAVLGYFAAITLVGLRLLQGICAGGQYAGVMTVLTEVSPSHQRALGCSISHVTSLLGYLAAVLVGWVSWHVFAHSHYAAWAWRLPFIAAAALWLINWRLRSRWQQAHRQLQQVQQASAVSTGAGRMPAGQRQRFPLYQLLSEHRPALLLSTALSMVMGGLYTSVFVYIVSFLQQFAHYSLVAVLEMNGAGLVLSCCTIPCFARLADVYGRRPLLWLGFVLLLLSVPLAVHVLLYGVHAQVLLANSWLILCVTLLISASAVTYCELFPHQVRYSGTAVSYNLGCAVCGGLTPFFLHSLIEWQGQPFCLAYYVMSLALLGCVVAYYLPETRA